MRLSAAIPCLLLPVLGAADLESRTVPGWGTWSKRLTPVFNGQYNIAGDPCVVRVGDRLRMVFGGFDPAKTPQGPATCGGESADGLAWSESDTGDSQVRGRLIRPGTGPWEDTHETPCWLRRPDGTWAMWFIGYIDHGGFARSFPACIGFAESDAAGQVFAAPATAPVIAPTAGTADAVSITAPSVVLDGGTYRMVYTGWSWTAPAVLRGTLMYAESADGRNWTKAAQPLLAGATLPAFCREHVAEPELVHAPDGTWLLFFTATQPGSGAVIGLARAPTATGPWAFAPDPIIAPTAGGFDATDAVAPGVLIEDGRIRLWYAGFNPDRTRIAIGYAESAWPLPGDGGSGGGGGGSSGTAPSSVSGGGSSGGGSGGGCGRGAASGLLLLAGAALASLFALRWARHGTE